MQGEGVMRKHTCSRCRREEPIPTNQMVKFDTDFHNLCKDCWEGFRSWFFAGERITRFVDTTLGPDHNPAA